MVYQVWHTFPISEIGKKMSLNTFLSKKDFPSTHHPSFFPLCFVVFPFNVNSSSSDTTIQNSCIHYSVPPSFTEAASIFITVQIPPSTSDLLVPIRDFQQTKPLLLENQESTITFSLICSNRELFFKFSLAVVIS